MFKKLKRRMLLINLGTISVLMLVAFISIYTMTYRNIQSSIDGELMRVADFQKDDHVSPVPRREDNQMAAAPKNLPDRTITFIINTNEDGLLVNVNSFFESDMSFFEEALSLAIDNGHSQGLIKLDGSYWSYMEKNNTFIFIDSTAQQSVLNRLIYTFLLVFFSMLLIIFFLSRYLADRSIRPVKDAFIRQKQFISDASHELKTPLAVIGSNVDVLLSNHTDSDSSDSKWLSYIKTEVTRMGQLTNDLLYLSKMESDESDNKAAVPFDLSEKAEMLLLGMEAMAYEKDISLESNIEPGIQVKGVSDQLAQVIMILLDNAFKYTPKGGTIKVNLARTAHHAVLSVANTGEGIAPEHLDKVFDRFYRAEKARSRQGGSYGLGLSIAKAIVDAHQGKIACESTPGDWTKFTVKLKIKN